MILVGGIGNIFFGDDGFGCEVAWRLQARPQRERVRIVDFGTRGIDLGYALETCDAAILVDTMSRGQPPGTLYLIQPALRRGADMLDPHGATPDRVLGWIDPAQAPSRLLLLGCEPASFGVEGLGMEGLSDPVRGAVDEAIVMIERLIGELVDA